MPTLCTRLVAWLSLALVLLAGLAPAQGLVVCVEADGCISIEFKAPAASCGPCEEHDEDELPSEEGLAAPSTPACPCVDYVVLGLDEHVGAKRSTELQVDFGIGPAVASHVIPLLLAPTSARAARPSTPRVARALAHLRSVILRV